MGLDFGNGANHRRGLSHPALSVFEASIRLTDYLLASTFQPLCFVGSPPVLPYLYLSIDLRFLVNDISLVCGNYMSEKCGSTLLVKKVAIAETATFDFAAPANFCL
jgi:hypothetical protein